MSFNIDIQKNLSEKNKFTKTISTVLTLSGTLKEDTSIIDPVILIEASMSDLNNANYLSIADFGRSYFITDIKSVRNGLIEVSAHVDVLTSFKNQILSNRGIIRRQQNAYNLNINDGVMWQYENPIVITKNFPSGFSTAEYVFALAGRLTSGGEAQILGRSRGDSDV